MEQKSITAAALAPPCTAVTILEGFVSGTEMVIPTPASVNSSLVKVRARRIHFLFPTF